MIILGKIFQKLSRTMLLISICFISISVQARTTNLYITENPGIADIIVGFNDNLGISDIGVWIGQTSFTDVDVCFTNTPTPNSIEVDIVTNPGIADIVLCITDRPSIGDKVICLTPNASVADICLGLWDAPQYFTTDIYINGMDEYNLTDEMKVSILYALGLLKKK